MFGQNPSKVPFFTSCAPAANSARIVLTQNSIEAVIVKPTEFDDKEMKQFNGPAILVAMLRELDPISRKKFEEKLSSVSPILAKLSEHCEFIYADIYRLDDKSLQNLIATITEPDWLLAWKLSSHAVREKLLKNMSARRRENFLEQIQHAPKVHRKRVIKVQKTIAEVCHQKLKSGDYRIHSRRVLDEIRGTVT